MRPTRSTLLAMVIALLALTGCASGTGAASPDPDTPVEGPSGGPSTEPTSPPQEPTAPGTLPAELTVVLDETGSGSTVTMTLTCAPAGGDHPDPDAACAALQAAGGAEAFAPTPGDVACTEQWGGPQLATVTGTVDGAPVAADFSRVNGCEISRWDALAPLLGTPGGA